MGVGHRDAASNDAHACEIVDVVADVYDVFCGDATPREQRAKIGGLVPHALRARQAELATPGRYNRMRFGGEHEHVESQPPHAVDAEPVTAIACDPLLSVPRGPDAVVRHD